ncbi:MAG: PEPxxWA-CTERM sorting domain-containing protein [Pseudomonadota bacterium]
MSKLSNLTLALAAWLVAGAAPAVADAAVVDAAGDFLSSYTGPQNGDLDILEAGALLGADDVTLSMVLYGSVGSTAGAFVAFGVNRGGGTPGLFQSTEPMIGGHALHDAVVVLRPNLTGTVVLIGAGGALSFANLAPGAVAVSGDSLQGVVPLSLLPSNGFAVEDYRYSAWTRSAPGSNAFVGDFAPDGATFRAAVPEPATWALMILGFGSAGVLLRRRPARFA